MILNTRLSIEMLVNAIAIVLIGCISVPAAIAQPTTPSSATPPPQPAPEQPQVTEQPQQNSYVGFGGVIGIQGGTTSLSQGTFSVFSKHVLTQKC